VKAMQMDIWYDVMLQELIEANSEVHELLDDAEAGVDPETIEKQAE
jgi:hypothetical protein